MLKHIIKMHKPATAVLASLVLMATYVVAPFGAPKASAACSTNVYEITSSVANIYDTHPPGAYIIGAAHKGWRLHGPTGGTYGYLTVVYFSDPQDWIYSFDRAYIGCY